MEAVVQQFAFYAHMVCAVLTKESLEKGSLSFQLRNPPYIFIQVILCCNGVIEVLNFFFAS